MRKTGSGVGKSKGSFKKRLIGGKMDLNIITTREIDRPLLAVEAAIDLENFNQGRTNKLELERVQKLKEWLLATEEIYSNWGLYFEYHNPKIAIALNCLLADFFQQPKCQRFSELGERIRAAIELFTYFNEDEIGKLKDFCLKMSQMFLKLEIKHHGPCWLGLVAPALV